MTAEKSLQETYAPQNRCFGCGPANEKGLRIRSFVEGDFVVLRYRPEPYHLAFEGAVNGGILGTLFDCHCNWTAAYHIMRSKGLEQPPATVTAEFCVRLKRVTPLGKELLFRARPVKIEGDRAEIEAELEVEGKVTATCKGTFVAVSEGHPAFFRW
jgi:acyl-coenzyme A thioesterase PaaI-like protein